MATPKEKLGKTLSYIEEYCQHPLTLEELTDVSGLSRFALIRLFTRLLNMTPMEYVRQRRLALSLPELLKGERIIDIALNAGFEHEQSYIRAFRDVYHMTPAHFRRQDQPVPIIDIPRLAGFTVSHSGMLGKPDLLVRPAFSFTGMLQSYNYADNLMDGSPLFDGLQKMRDKHYAACRVSNRTQFTHLYLVERNGMDNGAVTWHYPAGRWARFQYIGLHPLDSDGVRRMRLMASLVVSAWYAERGARWDGQFLERVEKDWLNSDYCEVELLCPVDEFK